MLPEWSQRLADENIRSTIKELNVLPPMNYPLSDDVARKSCIVKSNVLYVYPLQFERIPHR